MNIHSYTNTYQNLFNQMPGFFALATLDHKYAFGNFNTAKIMGFKSTDDLVNVDFFNVKCEAAKDAIFFRKENELIFTCLKKVSFLGYHQYADQWRLVLCEKSPLFTSDNILAGVIIYWTDITNFNLVDYSRFILSSRRKLVGNENKSFSYILEDGSTNYYKLSERQVECLFFLLRSKSIKEIANALQLSPRTVESYIDEIKLKMRCVTKRELIDKSFHEGLFNIIPKSFLSP